MDRCQEFLIRFFCVLSLLLRSGAAFGQTFESTLVGSISVKGGAGYVYKLHFKDSAGIIKGYSITDVGGADETRSAITGTINASGKELVFKETKILNTKSEAMRDSFCFVQAKLKMKSSKALKGGFVGYMKDGRTKCATGDIVLYSTADIMAKLMKLGLKIDTAALARKDTAKVSSTPIPSPPVKLQVLPGETLELSGESKKATLEVWDDMNIDGDVITIKHNDKVILEKYKLTAERKRLDVKLSGNVDNISIIAQSEGTEPPNTARLKLVSGGVVYYLDASTKIGKPAHIIIKSKTP